MKELTIEQKAQRYDEAIEKLHEIITMDNRPVNPKEIGAYLFPELAESEDEKIRKEIINYFEHHPNIIVKRERKSDWISWLEKQQKPVQEIEPAPIFKIGDILKRKGKDYTFRVDKIQGGYYHCDRNHGAFFPIKEQGNWELVEQKPVEDRYMEGYLNGTNDALKTLKPASWSEEDENMVEDTIQFIDKGWTDNGKSHLIPWLKSIRLRNTWKPSDEQMNALESAVSSLQSTALESLYYNLTKINNTYDT